MVTAYCCGAGCGGSRCGSGCAAIERFAGPGGEEIDAALVVGGGVGGEVGFDGAVVVRCGLEFVAGVVDGSGEKGVFVVGEILLDGGAEEIEEGGVVARGRTAFAGELPGEDLLLE